MQDYRKGHSMKLIKLWKRSEKRKNSSVRRRMVKTMKNKCKTKLNNPRMYERETQELYGKWKYCKVRLWRQEVNTINITLVDTNILYKSGCNSGKSYPECKDFSRCVGIYVNIRTAAVAAGVTIFYQLSHWSVRNLPYCLFSCV